MNVEIGIGEERLSVIYRTIKLPEELWENVKNRAQQEQKVIRWIIDEILDAELLPLIESLRKLSLDGEEKKYKLVRIPLDDNVIGRLNHGRRQTGLPAVLLLRICLQKFTKNILTLKAPD